MIGIEKEGNIPMSYNAVVLKKKTLGFEVAGPASYTPYMYNLTQI